MTTVRARAPGKVNLCLFLGGVRPDGRHELVSLVESVSLADELELASAPEGAGRDEVDCPGVEGPNLAADALAAFRCASGWTAEPQRLAIAKRVPVAAGMGGGSADAAAALRLAQAAAGAPLEPARLRELAIRLGADVPSQLAPGLVLATGAGEAVSPVPPRSPHAIVIVPSPQRLSTAEVYAEADRLGLPRSPADLAERREAVARALAAGPELPLELIANDLEPAARALCPQIDDALAAVRETGAAQVLVSGSGPTVFGLHWGAGARERARASAAALAQRFASACAATPVDADYGEPERRP